MLNLLLRIFLNAIAVLVVTNLIPGVFVRDFMTAFFAAIVLGLINALIRPILEILSLPITILTLGLFSLVINALMFWLASAIVPGFEVHGFAAAFWGGMVFWIVSWASNALITDRI